MHFLFRLVSAVVMVVALTHCVLILADAKQYTVTPPNSTANRSGADEVSVSQRLRWLAVALYSPASLFCLAAILWALTRISWVQEQGKDID
jgi:hypothetical protein